jgi:hypothetical protein
VSWKVREMWRRIPLSGLWPGVPHPLSKQEEVRPVPEMVKGELPYLDAGALQRTRLTLAAHPEHIPHPDQSEVLLGRREILKRAFELVEAVEEPEEPFHAIGG